MTFDGDLLQSNVKLLHPYFSASILELLKVYTPANLDVLVDSDGRAVDLRVGSQELYGGDADSFALNQVSAYAETPERITFGDHMAVQSAPTHPTFSARVSWELMEHRSTYSMMVQPDFTTSAAMVSLGIGMGRHLNLLVDRFGFRDLILVEPSFDLFYASLCITDWTAITEQVASRGGRIQFILAADAEASALAIIALLKGPQFGLIEGSYIYRHYGHRDFALVLDRLRQSRADLISYNGWMEDELVHFRNHCGNAARGPNRFLTETLPSKSSGQHRLACLVGSGPSLDNDLSVLRENRDRYTLFSCGTSLKPILASGLIPDFHVELENVDLVLHVLKSTSADYDLSRITLLASSTINPDVPNLFGDVVYFLREGDGLMSAVAPSIGQIGGVGPSCVNAAMKAAELFGFESAALFGVDFCVPSEDRHHAKGSIYDTPIVAEIGEPRTIKLAKGSAGAGSDIQAKANFGGVAHTNATMILMRNLLELNVASFSGQVFNCSDGLEISGTLPKRSDVLLAIDSHAGTRPDARSLVEQCPMFEPDAVLDKEQVRSLHREANRCLAAFRRTLTEIAERAPEKPVTDVDMLKAFGPVLPDSAVDKPIAGHAVSGTTAGTFQRLFHLLRYIGCRLGQDRDSWYRQAAIILLESLNDASAVLIGGIARYGAASGLRLPMPDFDQCLQKIWSDGVTQNDVKCILKIAESVAEPDKRARIAAVGALECVHGNGRARVLEELAVNALDELKGPTVTAVYQCLISARISDSQTGLVDSAVNHRLLAVCERKKPMPAVLQANSAFLEFLLGNDAGLKAFINDSVQRPTANANELAWRGILQTISGDLKAAATTFARKETEKLRSEPYHALALYGLGKSDEAFALWEKSLATSGRIGESYYFRAFAKSMSNDLDAGRRMLREANKLYPEWQSRNALYFDSAIGSGFRELSDDRQLL